MPVAVVVSVNFEAFRRIKIIKSSVYVSIIKIVVNGRI